MKCKSGKRNADLHHSDNPKTRYFKSLRGGAVKKRTATTILDNRQPGIRQIDIDGAVDSRHRRDPRIAGLSTPEIRWPQN
jgi:hypothetical protein